jgi:hypothetical protein
MRRLRQPTMRIPFFHEMLANEIGAMVFTCCQGEFTAKKFCNNLSVAASYTVYTVE